MVEPNTLWAKRGTHKKKRESIWRRKGANRRKMTREGGVLKLLISKS